MGRKSRSNVDLVGWGCAVSRFVPFQFLLNGGKTARQGEGVALHGPVFRSVLLRNKTRNGHKTKGHFKSNVRDFLRNVYSIVSYHFLTKAKLFKSLEAFLKSFLENISILK